MCAPEPAFAGTGRFRQEAGRNLAGVIAPVVALPRQDNADGRSGRFQAVLTRDAVSAGRTLFVIADASNLHIGSAPVTPAPEATLSDEGRLAETLGGSVAPPGPAQHGRVQQRSGLMALTVLEGLFRRGGACPDTAGRTRPPSVYRHWVYRQTAFRQWVSQNSASPLLTGWSLSAWVLMGGILVGRRQVGPARIS